MTIKFYLLITAVFFPCFIVAQADITRNGGSTTVSGGINGSISTVTISNKDIGVGSGGHTRDGGSYDRGGGRDDYTPLEGNYDGPASEHGWGESNISRKYDYKLEGVGLKKDNDEAMSVLLDMKGLLSDDCIDVGQLQDIQTRFNSLSPSQKSALGYEGEEVFAQLRAKLNNVRPLYSQYLIMAQNIKNYSFSNIDKGVMHMTYEEQNGYLKQFLSKEEFDRAKIEYEKYEKAQVVNNVYEKIRAQELRKINDDRKAEAEKTNYFIALQKVRRTYIDNYKVGEMAVKNISEGHNQLTIAFGEEFIPKSKLLERLNDGINTVNKAKDIKGIFVKAFLGDYEGALSDYRGRVKETIFDPLKNCAKGLGATVTGSYNTVKRVFNFGETLTTITKDTWNGVENAIREAERGNCDAAWRILFRTEQKDLNTTKKGINNAF